MKSYRPCKSYKKKAAKPDSNLINRLEVKRL